MDDIITIEKDGSLVSITLDDNLFERWLVFLDITNEKTKNSYRVAIKRFAQYLSDFQIRYPTRQDLYNYREHLLTTTHETSDGFVNYSQSTVRLYITVVKLFFKWLEYEKVYKNIALGVKSPVIQNNRKKKSLTPDQVKLILSAIDTRTLTGARDYAIIVLMTTTGLRTESVSLANVGDISSRGNDTHILVYKGKGHTEKDTEVYITKEAYEAIQHYFTKRLSAGGNVSKGSPLFVSASNENKNQFLSTRSYRKIIKERMKAVGIDDEKYTAHSLRHTAATVNIRNGGTLEETQQLLNHKDIHTTMIYLDEIKKEDNKSEFRIAKAIFGDNDDDGE